MTTPTPGTPLAAERRRSYTPGQSEAMSSPATMETAARAGSRREPIDGVKQVFITVLATLLVSVILGFVALSLQLSSMQRHMHEEFGGVRTDIRGVRGDIGRLRSEMRTEFRGLRSEMRTEFRGLRSEMRTEFRGLRDEMRGLRSEMRTEFRGLSDQMTRIETLLQMRYGPFPGS